MSKDELLIGEVAKRTGVTRKALRLYEEAGILRAPRRTTSGYRVYDKATLDLLTFVRQAQRLGFSLDEIREIVSIQRSGRVPCPHVRTLVLRKQADLNRRLADLAEMRKRLSEVLRGWQRGAERPLSAFTSNSRTDSQQGGDGMEKRVSLCPMCDHCPEVALVGDEVRIGEAGNLVVLKKDEWNVLVDAITAGRLSKV